MPKILIVDDNRQIAAMLADYARQEGYNVFIAHDGEDAVAQVRAQEFDILLLDVMMPKMDGFEACRQIRSFSNVPIIMVTARGEDFERIMGLDIGADDYVVKPSSPAEIMARVRAVLRRIVKEDESQAQLFTYGDLKVNLDEYSTSIGSTTISLTKKETELLWLLATNKNKVFTRDNLLNSIWGFDYYGDMRTVDSHIKRLRAKLEEVPHQDWEIKTIWGVGYKFEVLS